MVDERRNLLAETLEELASNGKTPNDVRWVGFDRSGHYRSPGVQVGDWPVFALLADREYDAGFGRHHVEESLLVVGDDWWLERHEYDGSEWWEFKSLPRNPANAEPLTRVFD